jgi:alpha-L-rhamnosidase
MGSGIDPKANRAMKEEMKVNGGGATPDWASAARWIWTPGYRDDTQKTPGKYVNFRKTFTLPPGDRPSQFTVHVSADSRYRLFINERSVSFGPCKSYPERWFYETVDIAPYLVDGLNVVAARVLRYPYDYAGSSSIIRTALPGFMLHGSDAVRPVMQSRGIILTFRQSSIIATDQPWKAQEDLSTMIAPYSDWNYLFGPPFMCNNEIIDEGLAQHDWKSASFDDSSWPDAVVKTMSGKMLPATNPWKLAPRPIPMLPEIPKTFSGAVKCSGPVELAQWSNFLRGDSPVTIPAGSTAIVDVDSTFLTTGFIALDCQRGAGAKIKLTCAECYEKDNGKDKSPFPEQREKKDRTNHGSGRRLYGTEDIYTVGNSPQNHTLEPFWFRAFRYVQLHITCDKEDLTLTSLSYRETHYPLEISTQVKATQELDSMWDISLRTLKNCMHETYEDCPFYEQNQFVFDSRLQILFTYQLCGDDRLARKALEEFHASRCPDGLVKAHYPAGYNLLQIPMFSLFYILMVHDHMQFFGDKAVARKYFSTVDGILNYYDCRLNEFGLVGRFDPADWAFVDWVVAWSGSMNIRSTGMPPAYRKVGSATVFSLIYSMALLHAADICDFLERHSTAEDYRQRSQAINNAVNRHCYENGMYLDGPGVQDRSQHPQVFAVLCGAITGPAAKKLMKRTLEDSTLAPCSYAMKFYLFRAVEKAGLYTESFDTLIEPWRVMMAENLTTWCENDANYRSDCHGWSAAPVYELITGIFGLKPTAPGFRGVVIEPRRSLSAIAKASLWTPNGTISIEWVDGTKVVLEASEDMEVELVLEGARTLVQLSRGTAKVCGEGMAGNQFIGIKVLERISSWLYKIL